MSCSWNPQRCQPHAEPVSIRPHQMRTGNLDPVPRTSRFPLRPQLCYACLCMPSWSLLARDDDVETDAEEKSVMYTPQPIDTSEVQISEELRDLIELLARNTHDVWAQK